jgi:hypothetical protein
MVRYQHFGGKCCLHLLGQGMTLQNAGILPQHYTASQLEIVTCLKITQCDDIYILQAAIPL